MRDTSEHLRRIQSAITKIAGYVNEGRARFDKEEEVRISIIRHLQTISEAAQAIPQDFRDHHSAIPWKQMISFQDFLTFYYIEVDRDNLWNIAAHDIPNLKLKIDAIIIVEASEEK
ncbi:MAG TPA: HepT-like ribonuclease domain-containing protein [Ktedonobacteraceae bacterium]|nr:HepT-like ribonuclease domain-containing protein [Ktedonobacteraceae bacterium]